MSKIEKHTGRRVVVDLDELDVRLIISAIKLAHTTRTAGRLLGLGEPQPLADEREKKLLTLLESAIHRAN